MAEQTAVQTFDPQARVTPTQARMDKLLVASLRLDVPNYGLSDAEIEEYAPLMQCQLDEWQAVIKPLDNLQLVDLARFFTLAERLPGWQAGDRSPVIAFMAELRKREAVPPLLGNWIRRSTDNRFLPWGSLQSRL
ncbi:MAG: hypothetical protein OXF72_06265 [Gammaproteobacteria bacterium]|nr:hypothetical protein [Gammaproteobacteria bacterium]MCY4199798.1 hypothetical protein [Gammaproteobacteria bacterium]MCY4276701.1 hypothetical protein [Gammaproteobacteria bacterium]MCY4323229.1 hypothetical protein [Gammaproteobacteria bacterium]